MYQVPSRLISYHAILAVGQWLCQEDVELLKGWKEKTRREDAELVADSGYRQLNEMGKVFSASAVHSFKA